MLEPNSIRVGKSNRKKLLHFFARPIIWTLQKYLTFKNQPYLGTFNNLVKAYNQHRKNNSSQNQRYILNEEKTNLPHPYSQSEDTKLVFLNRVDLTEKFYMDQTGRFPIISSKGKKYILTEYHYYSNTIHAEPLKTQTGLDLNILCKKIHSLLTDRGLKPSLYILYNECTNVLKTFMR